MNQTKKKVTWQLKQAASVKCVTQSEYYFNIWVNKPSFTREQASPCSRNVPQPLNQPSTLSRGHVLHLTVGCYFVRTWIQVQNLVFVNVFCERNFTAAFKMNADEGRAESKKEVSHTWVWNQWGLLERKKRKKKERKETILEYLQGFLFLFVFHVFCSFWFFVFF